MKKKEGQNSTFSVSGNQLNTHNVFGQKLPIISFLNNLYSLAEIFSQVLTSKHSTQDQSQIKRKTILFNEKGCCKKKVKDKIVLKKEKSIHYKPYQIYSTSIVLFETFHQVGSKRDELVE